MELPSHPESEDPTPYRKSPPGGSRATMAVFVVMGILIAVVVILHLTGLVGPGAQ